MSKVSSHCLLVMTLVFSTAHAPTFQLWGFGGATEPSIAEVAAVSAPRLATTAALQHEYAEDDDLRRFHLDELLLPNLDVSLPELFEWSDLDRAYLADVGTTVDAPDFAPDDSPSLMRVATILGGPSFRGSSGLGVGAALGSNIADEAPLATGTDDSSQTGKGDSLNGPSETLPADESNTDPSGANDSQLADDDRGGDPLPTDTLPEIVEPISPETPVPVPAPGAFFLFALGLAGLQLAGRKKNRCG
jgi:hypothetical protein